MNLLKRKYAEDPAEAPSTSTQIDFQGIPVVIEYPVGSTRSGVDEQGQPWEREMDASYGYIPGTVGAGDHESIDAYVYDDDDADSTEAYIIEQCKADGSFDEFKIMLGFPDADQALSTYLAHYPQDWVLERVEDIWSVDYPGLLEAINGKAREKAQPETEVLDDAQGKVAAEGDTESKDEGVWHGPKKKRNKYGPKPENYKNILTYDNAKTSKGEKLNYKTGIMYLAPAKLAGGRDLCPGRSPGCTDGCLNTAGRGGFTKIQKQRIAKTKYMFANPGDHGAFMESLRYDIRKLEIQAAAEGMHPAVRINGTSDIPKLAMKMAKEFPEVQFYDYTKLDRSWRRKSENYHVTFSKSEINDEHMKKALANGINVAAVFNTKKGQDLPTHYLGYEVIDGDEHDLRFLDEATADGSPVIVGLRAKGKAKKKGFDNGFVVKVEELGEAGHPLPGTEKKPEPEKPKQDNNFFPLDKLVPRKTDPKAASWF